MKMHAPFTNAAMEHVAAFAAKADVQRVAAFVIEKKGMGKV